MSKNITIIGAGQLGSRHLQALALVKDSICIQVVDTSQEALAIAESRFNEVSATFSGKISFHTSIAALEKEQEIVIVATGSKIRRSIIEELLAHAKVKSLILEKFLFVKEEDYSFVEQLLNEKQVATWVNCPRRMMSLYRTLQQELTGKIHFVVNGNAWGLGCNGIHLLDLFSFLTNERSIQLSNDLIDKQIIESKRPGYIEFTGTITGHANGHSFHMTSFSEGASPLQLIIHTATAKYSIQEGATAKVWISKQANQWAWEEHSFTMPFQSQLTNIVVDDILATGNCTLTTYKESAHLHILFLNNLLAHLRKVNNDNTLKECLIT